MGSKGKNPPAPCHCWIAVISFKIPLKSPPKGGTPPELIGENVSGGKPSWREALPLVIPICEAAGIVLMYPELAAYAKGKGIFEGMLVLCIFSPIYIRELH